MALNKVKLGNYISLNNETNSNMDFATSCVVGVNLDKKIIPTKADTSNADVSKYYIVNPGDFIYNPRTHGKRIGLGFNDRNEAVITSWNNSCFKVKDTLTLLPEYLYMNFCRDEWDREACFQSWGSSTVVFTWDSLCNMQMYIPPIAIQQKYVNIYKAMVANLNAYENGLDDLKLTCDGYIENLKKSAPIHKLGEYIKLSEERNADNRYGLDSVRGISIEKKFIPTKADMEGVNLSPYYVVKPDYYAYVSVTSRNGDKISLALNDSPDTYICSSSYIVFKCNKTQLNPRYLRIILGGSKFDRYARFNSWGSARETFDWSEICNVEIPVPDLSIQKSIADIFSVYNQRKKIAEKMRENIKSICPVLIQGAIREAMQK